MPTLYSDGLHKPLTIAENDPISHHAVIIVPEASTPYQSFQTPGQVKHSGIYLPKGLCVFAIGAIFSEFSLLERLQAINQKDTA